jgi:hypothetical protein
MYKVKIMGEPKPATDAQKAKHNTAVAKAKKEGKEPPVLRDRPSVLSTFTVDSDDPIKVTTVVANTVAKQSQASRDKVRGLEMRRVGASDPGTVQW